MSDAWDFETRLRQALAPVEPPPTSSRGSRRALGSLVELAADELEAWELRSMRDPRNWVAPGAPRSSSAPGRPPASSCCARAAVATGAARSRATRWTSPSARCATPAGRRCACSATRAVIR